MNELDRVARAICRVYFGDVVTHGDARCCQIGGKDGCCVESLYPVAHAAINAIRTQDQEAQ